MSVSQNFPEVRPTLNLNFARSKTLDPRITFTRASTGTYVDEDGLIKTAATDAARFDHDQETGESLGLLIEEQRTNLFPNSNAFVANVPPITLTSSFSTSPDGTTTATRLQGTQNGTGSYINVGATAGVTYTSSVYAKRNSGSGNLQLIIYDLPSANATAQTFTLTDEWQRFYVTRTVGSNQNTIQCRFVGSGSSFDILVWGAQVEVGSFPTSYIPTSGSTVTRNADVAYITQANMQSWYNNTEGTIFSHSIGYRGVGGIAYFGSNTEGWGLFQNGSSLTNKGRTSYTPDLASDNTILSNTYEIVKAGISINDTTNLSNYAVNGIIRGDSQTRSGPFTYPTGFGLAQADVISTNQVRHSLCLNRIVYYPVSLSASQIQTLTK